MDKAISLLKKLDTEKQNGIGPEVVRGEKNLITHTLDFFRRFLRPKPEEPNKTKIDDRKPTEIEADRESAQLTAPATHPKSNIDYIIKDKPLQNEYRENIVEPSLNGKPYYSEENGFYWAANHQGIAECLPQHIKRIIHNEELEIASTRDEIEQEIDYLREEIVELEAQKNQCEQEITQQNQEFSEKKEELAGLDVELKALAVNRWESTSTEGISNDSNPESFNTLTVEDISNNPVIQQHTEINELIQEKAYLEQAIDEKSQALAGKKEELAGLEVELQGPTEVELNSLTMETTFDDTSSTKHRVSGISFITAIISTIFFVFLAIYLFIFYASAVDKAFFLNTEAIQAQLAQGTYAGVNDVVNPKALFKAFQGEWNLFIVMFSICFLSLCNCS